MSARTLLAFALLLTGSLAVSQTPAKRFSWPSITDQQRSYSFRDALKAKLSITLRSGTGRPLYLLQCANTDLSGEGEVMPGDFACWLKATDPRIVSRIGPENLLSSTPFAGSHFDDSDNDDYCRECVWARQLAGRCGDYPDFGRERTFRLRGTKITLTFRNVEISPENDHSEPTLRSFDLSVSVQRDEGAISSIAAPSLFEIPGSDEHGCDSARPSSEERAQTSSRYPVIRKTEFDFDFPVRTPSDGLSRNPHTPDWIHSIVGEDGSLAYEFSCRADENALEQSTPTIISGPRYAKEGIGIVNAGIWCRLLEAGTSGPNLLDLSPDPYSRTSRAEIFPDQLRGACADYPEWGRKRSFRLRGMKLMIFMDELKFGRTETDLARFRSPDLIGAKIHVTVAPDPSATSPVPEQVKYADWSLLPTTCRAPILNPHFVAPVP